MFPSNTRILIVDDMITMRSLIKNQLRHFGLSDFVDAENGEVAMSILKERYGTPNSVQLILSDWNMPVMSGIDFLKKVRSAPEFQTLPFILITAEGDAQQVKEAIENKVSNFIRKPFSPATIQEKLVAVWKKYNS